MSKRPPLLSCSEERRHEPLERLEILKLVVNVLFGPVSDKRPDGVVAVDRMTALALKLKEVPSSSDHVQVA